MIKPTIRQLENGGAQLLETMKEGGATLPALLIVGAVLPTIVHELDVEPQAWWDTLSDEVPLFVIIGMVAGGVLDPLGFRATMEEHMARAKVVNPLDFHA